MLHTKDLAGLATYQGRLTDWAEDLQARKGTIVAIARKGPRLLELLVRDGLLPHAILGRVISDRALPFWDSLDEDLIVIDDSIIYGSTFDRVVSTARERLQEIGSNRTVVGLPFAVAETASNRYQKLAERHYLSLKQAQLAPFIRDLVCAFRLLGKPYDIEHPMLTFRGDFSNQGSLDSLVTHIASALDGEAVPLHREISTRSGTTSIMMWAVLLREAITCSLPRKPELAKLRVYLSPELDRLTVAGMCPCAVARDDFRLIGDCLDSSLCGLWMDAVSRTAGLESPSVEQDRSLVMWSNFLSEVSLLKKTLPILLDEVDQCGIDVHWYGPRREDLTFLVGSAIAGTAEGILRNFLGSTANSSVALLSPEAVSSFDVPEERMPHEYVQPYQTLLSRLLETAATASEVVKAIFYAQHRAIEVPSRSEQRDAVNRLEFGIRFSGLSRRVSSRFPSADWIDLHRCLDILIDDGCVVPRYLDFGEAGNPVWARGFRIGEVTVPMTAHTVKLLFEKMTTSLKAVDLPAVLFEKFAVLTLSVMTDEPRLGPLRTLGTRKGFHLYGARQLLVEPQREEFLLDWAVAQKILCRSDADEARGNFQLTQIVASLYPDDECPWNDEVKDALEDAAAFAAILHKSSGLRDDALVTITSVATERELHKALEAELFLWLRDRSYSVYHALGSLVDLASSRTGGGFPQADLDRVNRLLISTARITAQVEEKIKLADNRKSMFSKIERAVSSDTLVARVWRHLSTTLASRIASENDSPGRPEIVSALRVAYRTNRILRDLLGMAGREDERNLPINQSVALLRSTLANPKEVNVGARAFFRSMGTGADIDEMLAGAVTPVPAGFEDAVLRLRPIVLEIAERCELILRECGTEDHWEAPETLAPPKFILMWDVRSSSALKNREDLERVIRNVCSRIKAGLGDRVLEFDSDSKDDGNGLVCERFADVLSAFEMLSAGLPRYVFRAGCNVNLQGALNYYPGERRLGGKAYEHAARMRDLFDEIASPAEPRWSGGPVPSQPDGSYLVVCEFARRYAVEEGTWPPSGMRVIDLPGSYSPRVAHGLPVSVSVILAPTNIS